MLRQSLCSLFERSDESLVVMEIEGVPLKCVFSKPLDVKIGQSHTWHSFFLLSFSLVNITGRNLLKKLEVSISRGSREINAHFCNKRHTHIHTHPVSAEDNPEAMAKVPAEGRLFHLSHPHKCSPTVLCQQLPPSLLMCGSWETEKQQFSHMNDFLLSLPFHRDSWPIS